MSVLDQLTTVDFEIDVGMLLPTPLLRKRLRAAKVVGEIVGALRMQLIRDDDIAAFTRGILQNFVAGRRFDHDLALAAIAVVLEDRWTPFADDFLRKLSSLHLTEVSTATRIARECSTHRAGNVAGTNQRSVLVGVPSESYETVVFSGEDRAKWGGVESSEMRW